MSRQRQSSLPRRVAGFARRLHLLPPGSRVAVAVSGGCDSVALFRMLLSLEPDLAIDVVGAVHVNHQLRGAASDRDEQFCRELAAACGRPVHVERIRITRGGDTTWRRSPEDAARTHRYEALDRGRQALGADLVALGHTRDDQAETVLLRLLRGTGPDGLAGIPPRRGVYVRPLLDTGRAELQQWLRELGQPWVEDATNADTSVPRNAVRHEVLPELERRVPSAGVTLARHASIARDDLDWTAGLLNPVFERLVQLEKGAVTVRSALCQEPTAVQRRILLRALRHVGVRHPGLDEVEAVRALLGGGRISPELPGRVLANRIDGDVVLTRGVTGRGRGAAVEEFRYSLQVPGAMVIHEVSALVTVEPQAPPGAPTAGTVEAMADADALGTSVVVRNWRPGDALRPVGLAGGRKKLQDLFVDAKVPRLERHRLPLLVDEDDRVLWVPGLAIDERLRVTSGTKAVVVLRLTHAQAQVGGPE